MSATSIRPRARPTTRLVVATAAVVGATVVLSGCLTGERPTLVPDVPVDDAAAATVLERLERADGARFTASYVITPTRTGQPTTALVVQDGSTKRITIGEVEFVTDGTVSETCQLDTGECVENLDDARISDLAVTHRFYAGSFAQRLELDASRRIAASAGSTTTIAGQPAVCVDVSIPSPIDAVGVVVYCAIEAGVLARYVGADVAIELTSFQPDA